MKRTFEYIILGAGPAGVQLGYYLSKRGRDYVILERGQGAGNFFATFPRHRKLISINKRFTGSDDPEFSMRHDWNSLLSDEYAPLFTAYDSEFFPHADNLVRYLADYVDRHGVSVIYATSIVEVARDRSEGFRLTDSDGQVWTARYLVVATGLSGEVRPDIPGIDLCDSYWDVALDLQPFENKRILILGKGNSAFETADHMIGAASVIHLASPRSITMAWKSHYVGNLRAVNNNLLDTYQLKSQNAVLDAEPISVRRRNGKLVVELRYSHANSEIEELVYDRVICCTGFKFDAGIYADDCMPLLTGNKKYPCMTAEFESVNVPGLHFAGTLTHVLDYRKTTSGFIHGFRYNARALAQMLDEKLHGEPLPCTVLEADAAVLADNALQRVNRSAGLWQQPGFLGDCLIPTGDGICHYQELPVGYVQQRFAAPAGRDCFLLTLEYGHAIEGDPFCAERIHRLDVEQARRSQFLHPVIRHFHNGECCAEHHVIEDLEGVWAEPEHRQPLEAFFRQALAGFPRQGGRHSTQEVLLQA